MLLPWNGLVDRFETSWFSVGVKQVLRILVGGCAVIALVLVGTLWAGVEWLPPAVGTLPVLTETPPPDLPFANPEAPLEVLPEQGAAKCLAGLKLALAGGKGPAAATYLDQKAGGSVGEMRRLLLAGRGLTGINEFWQAARLEQVIEKDDDCEALLMAGPGGRCPFTVDFRWNVWKRWVVTRVYARTWLDEQGGNREGDH